MEDAERLDVVDGTASGADDVGTGRDAEPAGVEYDGSAGTDGLDGAQWVGAGPGRTAEAGRIRKYTTNVTVHTTTSTSVEGRAVT